jgi:hypothetical protein
MPRQKLIPDLEALAARYSVGTRTIRRWHASGSVSLSDPCSVALHLAGQKSPAPAAVAAVRKILSAELESLT